MLRSMPDNGRDKVRTIISDFLEELSARGNDVSDCPYIVARHNNTDNEHYHIVILTTGISGKRFSDKFIYKNANRAATCIALKYELEAPQKAAEREKAHQEAEGKRRKERTHRQHKPSETQSQIDERMRRKRAVEEANKRKARLKYIIEKAAKESDFVGVLAKEGLTLLHDTKKGLCVRMIDTDGKERIYSLKKDLGIDMSILPANVLNASQSSANSKPSPPSKSILHPGIKDAPSGNSRNAEQEVNDGRPSDDLDEEWKRINGYKL